MPASRRSASSARPDASGMVDVIATVSVNREKVEADARWDGIRGVLSSLKDRPATEVLEQYRGLWQVEDAFRVTKRDLRIRPIHHCTPRRRGRMWRSPS